MRILVPLIAALVPLVITPGLLFHFDITPKIVIVLYGASLFAFFWRGNWTQFEALLELPEGRWFCALLGLQLAWMAISTLFSADVNLSLYGSEWRRFGLAANTAVILYRRVRCGLGAQSGKPHAAAARLLLQAAP